MNASGHPQSLHDLMGTASGAAALQVFAKLKNPEKIGKLTQIRSELHRVLQAQSARSEVLVNDYSEFLLKIDRSESRDLVLPLLIDICFYYWRINKNPVGRAIAQDLLLESEQSNDLGTQRRVHNMLGVHQLDAADFQSALQHLDAALKLAYTIKDPSLVAACLANAMLALKEMGHYHEAIEISKPILLFKLIA